MLNRKTRQVESTMKRGKKGRTLGEALLKGAIRFAGHVEVRGGHYHQMWEAKVDQHLEEGAWLKLMRQPDNIHDANAIAVFTKDGKYILGHIAKEQAERLAPFMDIGVKMALRVLSHSNCGQPLRLQARLYIKK
jgi:hypothetical protein